MSYALFWRTVRTYALWGFLWAVIVQWLGVLSIFIVGTLIDRPDLNFFHKFFGVFAVSVYAAIVFALPVLASSLVALPFILLSGMAASFWNSRGRTGYFVPLAAGVVFGAAFAYLNRYFNLLGFSKFPYFWAVDVACVALASTLCWRSLRKKITAVPS